MFFLLNYLQLRTKGIQCFGKVVAFEASKHVMLKNTLHPKIEVHGKKDISVVGTPISSWFAELNALKLHQEVALLQDKSDPEKFMLDGKAELIANALVIILTTGYMTWFIKEVI